MLRVNTNTCLIDYDAASFTLKVRALGPGLGRTEIYGEKQVSLEAINAACDDYWRFVKVRIETGAATGDENRRRAFYDDLKTRGARLTSTLLDVGMARRLWTLARNSDVLVLITGLLQVPWEALYGGMTAGFLSDFCVITRWPEDTGSGSREISQQTTDFAKERLVCLDRILESSVMLGDLSISNTFAGDGEEVYLTSLKRDLVGHVARVRLVHWICEHANQGLRLDDGVFYTIDDAAVFRFPRGSILVLTSCSTGADTPLGRSIAGGICASSDCTVIAPSSIVAAEASIQFVRAINATINQMPGSHSISHVWRKLRGLDIPSSETSSAPSAEMFFSLWYGMYGDAMTVIRS